MSNRFSGIIRVIGVIYTIAMVIFAIVLAKQLGSFWYFVGIALSAFIILISCLSYAALLDESSENYAMIRELKHEITLIKDQTSKK